MDLKEIPSLEERIAAFARLGKLLSGVYNDEASRKFDKAEEKAILSFGKSVREASLLNPWFTPANIRHSVLAWAEALGSVSLSQWLAPYLSRLHIERASKKVAVIMAGNIPLVGMHDFVSTLLAGHSFTGKLSSGDTVLLPAMVELLVIIEPRFAGMISFTDQKLGDFDAVIATGSNNTSRYFEYYFSGVPNIIRKNRNGAAVLDGTESDTDMAGLASDMCLYFGLGCRSVSKIFIPGGYDPTKILLACEPFRDGLFDHFKYMNNYIYQKTILQMNLLSYYDNGVIILYDSKAYASPISVVHYETYQSAGELKSQLEIDKEQIQCIACSTLEIPGSVALGATQKPKLWEYADGVDTLDFLLQLQ